MHSTCFRANLGCSLSSLGRRVPVTVFILAITLVAVCSPWAADAQSIPSAPSNLVGTAVSAFQINLNWVDTSTNEDGFKIERSLNGTNFTQIAQVLSNTTSYRNTSLFPNTTYYYRLRAFNISANSAYGGVTNATTPVLCPVSFVAWGENRAGQATPPAGLSNVFAIAAGYYQSLAIKTDGTLVGWGDGSVSPPALTGVVAIACGQAQSMALTNGGAVVCWGSNANGVSTPPASATNVVAVAAGKFHNLALRADGTVVGWGLSLAGETNTPASLNGVVAIAGGFSCSLALKSDGTVVGWGDNTAGQTNIPASVTNAIAIAAGSSACFALRSDGTVIGWGGNSLGELNIPAGLSGVVAIGSGDYHAMALKSDGTVVLWGYDPFGSLTPPVGMSAVMAIAVGEEHNVLITCAPAIPSSLVATNLGPDQIALSWIDNSWNEDGFKVERAQDSSGAPGTWSLLVTLGANVTSYTNSVLTLNTKYWYRVRSYNAAADSGFSNQVGLPTQPSAPINLAATPIYTNQVNLSWTDLSGYEDGFKIERAPDDGGVPGAWTQIAAVPSNTTAYSDVGLAGNSKYWYRIRAFNSAGNSVTSAISVTIPLSPSAPSGLGATPIGSTRIDLAWTDNASNEDGFKVERAPDNSGVPGTWAQIAATPTNITIYSDLGLVASTKYWYRVRAYNPGGDSPYSNQTNATTFGQNSWINPSSGRWEIAGNWSAGLPPASDQYGVVITNANIKTVTIDATTVSSNAINGCMVVSNLTVAGVAGSANTLQLTNAGTVTPLRIANMLTLTSGAGLFITNSAVQVNFHAYVGDSGAGTLTLPAGTMSVASNLVLGTSVGATGTLWLTGGSLSLTNPSSTTIVGNRGDGNVVVSNGTLLSRILIVGSNVFSRGTFTVAGGSVILSNAFVGLASNSVGNVWVTGGEFALTNNRVLTIGSFGAGQVTVSNAGSLRVPIVFMGLRSGGVGTLTLVGTTAFINNLGVGSGSNGLGVVTMSGGQLVATNAGITLASLQSTAQMTVSNATVLTRDMTVASGNNSTGTFTMNGGTLLFSSALTSNNYVGLGTGSKGAVWINGGQVVATNNGCLLFIGVLGKGQYTVTNGSVTVGNLVAGYLDAGTLSLSGSSFSVLGDATLAYASTGSIWVSNTQLLVPNGTFVVGNYGVGSLSVSSGVVLARSMIISSNYPAGGSLTIPGGQVTVFDKLVVGDCGTNAIGQITVNGGTLYVTNATHTGYIDLRDGTLTVSGGGVLIADRLVMTNTCGLFVRNGGSVSVGTLMLDTNLSAVGDGIPNGWKQQYGLDPLDPNLGGKDGDGDGMSNLQEYLAGTDPTNSSSGLRITAITQAGADVRVYFTSVGGKYYSLQRADFMGGVWTDIVTNIPGSVGIQWVKDIGAATRTSACYRIELSQLNSPPPADSDGDGIPDWWTQQYFGHPTGQASDNSLATTDPDGDGFSNLQEFLAGLDPTNGVSSFRIISIAAGGIDLLVTWMTGIGKTNALQVTTGGGYTTNSFTDIFTVTNTVTTVTNYLDVGGATNKPARYYRVRLVP